MENRLYSVDMNWLSALRCPHCKASGLAIEPAPARGDLLPRQGQALCHSCASRYRIANHVLDMAQRGDARFLTPAGRSNHLPLVPWGYEHIWRPRSLTLLTGERFPLVREVALLNEWVDVKPRELFVDLGSSTDVYGRGLGRVTAERTDDGPTILAIDMARNMLTAGRGYARAEGITRIAHIRAPVQQLPLGDATVDGFTCGGSLNEFRSMEAVLKEARRVCKPNGRMFAMTLIAARSRRGTLAQALAHASGIQFPSLDNLNAAIERAGWRRERHQVVGAVAFVLLRPAERPLS